VRAMHGEACLARTRRRRRSPGRRRAELGDDRRAPAISLSGRWRASCGGLPGRKAKWAAALLAYAAGAAAGPEARLRAAKLGRGDRCCRLLRAGLGW
jgi:hypothetical protein